MLEQYRIAGVILPSEDGRGFTVPYYKKVGGDETIFYANHHLDKREIPNFFEEPSEYKIFYPHIPIEEEYPAISVGNIPYCAVLLRDVNKKEHVVVGVDVADAYQKVVELSKHCLLDTDAFLWAEREKYMCFREKIDQDFILDVLKREIYGWRYKDKQLEVVDEDKRNSYWAKYILPMYNICESDYTECDTFVYCFEYTEKHIQFLAVFLKKSMSLHIHCLNVESPENPILLKSKFCYASFYDYSAWKEMIEEKFRLRLHWGK